MAKRSFLTNVAVKVAVELEKRAKKLVDDYFDPPLGYEDNVDADQRRRRLMGMMTPEERAEAIMNQGLFKPRG